jgi:hypothetical protein
MPTNYLPSDDHIARHIKPSLIMRDEVTHEAVGIFPQAFELRDAERDLSVSWLEVFAGSSFDQIRQVMEHTELRLSSETRFRYTFSIIFC